MRTEKQDQDKIWKLTHEDRIDFELEGLIKALPRAIEDLRKEKSRKDAHIDLVRYYEQRVRYYSTMLDIKRREREAEINSL